jgi:hypothetical protein
MLDSPHNTSIRDGLNIVVNLKEVEIVCYIMPYANMARKPS